MQREQSTSMAIVVNQLLTPVDSILSWSALVPEFSFLLPALLPIHLDFRVCVYRSAPTEDHFVTLYNKIR